jgi:hypothetical protein
MAMDKDKRDAQQAELLRAATEKTKAVYRGPERRDPGFEVPRIPWKDGPLSFCHYAPDPERYGQDGKTECGTSIARHRSTSERIRVTCPECIRALAKR